MSSSIGYQVCLQGGFRNALMSIALSPAVKFNTLVYLNSIISSNINFVASCLCFLI